MPNFLIPQYKAKLIDDLIIDGIKIGEIAGINLKPINFLDERQLELYIKGILKIKSEDDYYIYIEESEDIPLKVLNYMEDSTGLKFNTGDKTRIFNIPYIIKGVFNALNQDYNSKDTLIICNDSTKLKYSIEILSEFINFITVYGVDKSIKDEIYTEILDTTGISIFQPNNLDKVIKNYGIIINFNDILDFNLSGIRNDALILDFSRKKHLKDLSNNKKNIIIEEVGFDIGMKNSWILEPVNSSLLEGLDRQNQLIFSQVFTRNDFYFIKDFIDTEIKLRGRV